MNNDQRRQLLSTLRLALNEAPGPASERLTELAGRLDHLLKTGPAPVQRHDHGPS